MSETARFNKAYVDRVLINQGDEHWTGHIVEVTLPEAVHTKGYASYPYEITVKGDNECSKLEGVYFEDGVAKTASGKYMVARRCKSTPFWFSPNAPLEEQNMNKKYFHLSENFNFLEEDEENPDEVILKKLDVDTINKRLLGQPVKFLVKSVKSRDNRVFVVNIKPNPDGERIEVNPMVEPGAAVSLDDEMPDEAGF